MAPLPYTVVLNLETSSRVWISPYTLGIYAMPSRRLRRLDTPLNGQIHTHTRDDTCTCTCTCSTHSHNLWWESVREQCLLDIISFLPKIQCCLTLLEIWKCRDIEKVVVGMERCWEYTQADIHCSLSNCQRGRIGGSWWCQRAVWEWPRVEQWSQPNSVKTHAWLSYINHMTVTWQYMAEVERTWLKVCELAPFLRSHSTASDLPTNANTWSSVPVVTCSFWRKDHHFTWLQHMP